MKLSTDRFLGAVAGRYLVILVILIVALSISGIYAYGVLSPHYETITEIESITLYEYKAGYEHSTVVEHGNPLWPVGYELSNQSVYFSAISPNLNSSFNFQISAPSTEISANYLTKLILSSSYKDTTYWRKEKTISDGSMSLSGDDKLEKHFKLNITEIDAEIDTIQDSLRFYGGDVNAEVVTTVRYNGEVGGEKVDEQKEFSLPIEISGSTYEVPGESYEETIKKDVLHEVKVPLPPSKGDKIISYSSISILFLLIVAFTVIKLRYKPLDDATIQELIKEEEYGKFKDQISKGKLPSDADIKGMVRLEVKSLEDLTNIAIDTDERVIFDEEKSIYFFIHGNVIYAYSYNREG
ncbi:MAG: DUF5305 family protein [Halobacteriota archaeon]